MNNPLRLRYVLGRWETTPAESSCYRLVLVIAAGAIVRRHQGGGSTSTSTSTIEYEDTES